MEGQITTIKISKKTKERLEHLKVYLRETFDETMQKVLEILNICKVNPDSARARLIFLDRERKRNLKSQEKNSDKQQLRNLSERFQDKSQNSQFQDRRRVGL